MDCLTDNILEKLNISSIKRSFENLMYESNPQNYNFNDLPFDGDERLITRLQIYCLNDIVVEMLNNSLIVDVYINLM